MTNQYVNVRTMQEAVSALQGRVNKYNNEGFVENWVLSLEDVSRRDDDNNNDDDQNSVLWWDRFLTMLVLQESSRTRLESIAFVTSLLDRQNDEVLERLFRDALPTLSSVMEIRFTCCRILPALLDMFLTSLINNHSNNMVNLQALAFWKIQLNSSSVAAIARLLSSCAKNGNGPPLKWLSFWGCHGIDSTGCEFIFKALDGNTCLKSLNLMKNYISEISLDAARALGNCKNLSYLYLKGNPLSDQSFCHLAEGLRTNHSLTQLHLQDTVDGRQRRQLALDAVAELLKTFNYSLQHVSGIEELQGKEKLLLQNQRIRRLLDDLLERNCNSTSNTTTSITTTGRYHLPQLYLWPLALDCIGSKPGLVYRFLRHGNLESFSDQVLLLLAGSRNNSNSNSNSIVLSRSKNNPPKRPRIA